MNKNTLSSLIPPHPLFPTQILNFICKFSYLNILEKKSNYFKLEFEVEIEKKINYFNSTMDSKKWLIFHPQWMIRNRKNLIKINLYQISFACNSPEKNNLKFNTQRKIWCFFCYK